MFAVRLLRPIYSLPLRLGQCHARAGLLLHKVLNGHRSCAVEEGCGRFENFAQCCKIMVTIEKEPEPRQPIRDGRGDNGKHIEPGSQQLVRDPNRFQGITDDNRTNCKPFACTHVEIKSFRKCLELFC